MFRRSSSLIALAAVAAIAATALAQSVRAETFSMWVRSSGATYMPQVVNAFNASHETQVKLDIVPNDQLVQKFATALAAGNAPDSLSLDLIYTPSFAAAGQLADMSDWARSLPYFAALSPAHVKTGTWKGRIYGMPFSADASVLLWNKTLFKEAGLDPEKGPANWAEMRDAAAKVNALGDGKRGFYFAGSCGGCMIFTLMPLVWASGGDLFAPDGLSARPDSPQMRDAIALYRDMVDGGLVPESSQMDSGSDQLTPFASGKVGMMSTGAFGIGKYRTEFPDLAFGATFLPGKEGGWSSFAGGDNIVVPKDSTRMKQVQEFLDFAYSLEGQKILAKYGSLPVRTDIAGEALAGLDPRLTIAAEAMAKGRTPYTVAFNELINSANGPWIQMLNGAIFGGDVDESIAYAEEEMRRINDARKPASN